MRDRLDHHVTMKQQKTVLHELLETINYTVLGRYMQRCYRCKIKATIGQSGCKSTWCPSDNLHLCKLRSQEKLNYLFQRTKKLRGYTTNQKNSGTKHLQDTVPPATLTLFTRIFFLRRVNSLQVYQRIKFRLYDITNWLKLPQFLITSYYSMSERKYNKIKTKQQLKKHRPKKITGNS